VVVVVMGVSGCGKSTVGRLLAARLGLPFLDADEYHPPENVAKMAAGVPLEDADRWPWLERLNAELAAADRSGPGAVLACSALKAAYRDVLRASQVHVYLTVPFVLSWSLLDAMATGCAIVGSDTAPVREVIRDGRTGLLADMRSPPAIATAIARLLDDRVLAARLGLAARQHVLDGYALSLLLPQQRALVASLAAGKATRKRA